MQAPALILVALALSASALLPAQAQSKKELVDKVLKLQQAQVEQIGSQMLQSTLAPMVQQVGLALKARVPADKQEATGKALTEEIRAFTREVEPMLRASAWKFAPEVIAPKLDGSFNEAELKQLIQYLESPVIKRYGQLGSEMQGALVQKVGNENRAVIETKIRALDGKLSSLLGLKPAAPGSAPKP